VGIHEIYANTLYFEIKRYNYIRNICPKLKCKLIPEISSYTAKMPEKIMEISSVPSP